MYEGPGSRSVAVAAVVFTPLLAAGLGFIALFLVRGLWVPSVFNLAYRSHLLRLLFFPWLIVTFRPDREQAERVYRVLVYTYLLGGIACLVLAYQVEV